MFRDNPIFELVTGLSSTRRGPCTTDPQCRRVEPAQRLATRGRSVGTASTDRNIRSAQRWTLAITLCIFRVIVGVVMVRAAT